MRNYLRKATKWLLLCGAIAIAAVVLLPIIQSAVARKPEGDQTLRTMLPCEPPCWHSITPGQTTGTDAMITLGSLSFVRRETIGETLRPDGRGSYISWVYTGTSDYGAIRVKDGIVSAIEALPAFDLRLSDVVSKLGDPELVVPEPVLPYDSPWYYRPRFYYPSRGILFYSVPLSYSMVSDTTYEIKADFLIERAIYFTPQVFETLIQDIDALDDVQLKFRLTYHYPWRGYGKLPK